MSYPARCPVRRARIGNPRRGLVLDAQYLAWIRRQPCAVCGTRRFVQAAHVGARGLGQKASDYTAIPLCENHHVHGRDAHHVLQRNFFEHHGLDRAKLISELNERYRREKAA